MSDKHVPTPSERPPRLRSEEDCRKILEQRLADSGQTMSGIERAIIEDALENEEVRAHLIDIINHGCISGVVPRLITYAQTRKFFDTHYEEINQIREDVQSELGQNLSALQGDLRTRLAWYAYEHKTHDILESLLRPLPADRSER